MYIAGLEKNSFVDYPGQIAAVVFTPYCNYDCFYCHNREIIEHPREDLGEEMVFKYLQKRRAMLDAVVVSGGEPTMQKDLKAFIEKVKAMGFLVKLDTNGSNPEVLQTLLDDKLLDFVAMDYKAPLDRYEEICGKGVSSEPFLQCVDILKASGIDYELRTTFVPQLAPKDIEQMLKAIAPVKRYALQAYRQPATYKKEDRFRIHAKPHAPSVFTEAAALCEPYAEAVFVRK